MELYTYCRVGRSEQLQDKKTNLKVLAENKTIDEINKKLRSGIGYPISIIKLLGRKEKLICLLQ